MIGYKFCKENLIFNYKLTLSLSLSYSIVLFQGNHGRTSDCRPLPQDTQNQKKIMAPLALHTTIPISCSCIAFNSTQHELTAPID